MRKQLTLLLVAMMALPSLCAASDAIKDDSVKVIKSPEKVIITKGDASFRLNVEGNDSDKGYRYEYQVKAREDGKLYARESEDGKVRFTHPFSKCDSNYKKPHWQVFTSDLMFGWGGHSVADADRGDDRLGGDHLLQRLDLAGGAAAHDVAVLDRRDPR